MVAQIGISEIGWGDRTCQLISGRTIIGATAIDHPYSELDFIIGFITNIHAKIITTNRCGHYIILNGDYLPGRCSVTTIIFSYPKAGNAVVVIGAFAGRNNICILGKGYRSATAIIRGSQDGSRRNQVITAQSHIHWDSSGEAWRDFVINGNQLATDSDVTTQVGNLVLAFHNLWAGITICCFFDEHKASSINSAVVAGCISIRQEFRQTGVRRQITQSTAGLDFRTANKRRLLIIYRDRLYATASISTGVNHLISAGKYFWAGIAI